jgi:hypothetical protein
MPHKLEFLIEIAFAEYGNKCTYTIMFKGELPAVYVNLGDKVIADFWYDSLDVEWPRHKCYVDVE